MPERITISRTNTVTGSLNPVINSFDFEQGTFSINALAARCIVYLGLACGYTNKWELSGLTTGPVGGHSIPIGFPSVEYAALRAQVQSAQQTNLPVSPGIGSTFGGLNNLHTARGLSMCVQEVVSGIAANTPRRGRHFLAYPKSDQIDTTTGLWATSTAGFARENYRQSFLGLSGAGTFFLVSPAAMVPVVSRVQAGVVTSVPVTDVGLTILPSMLQSRKR